MIIKYKCIFMQLYYMDLINLIAFFYLPIKSICCQIIFMIVNSKAFRIRIFYINDILIQLLISSNELHNFYSK